MSIRGLGPSILLCTLIVGFEILYHRKKDDNRIRKEKQKFWERESEANSVRKKDITFLDYIDVPLQSLPMEPCDDEEITEYQDTIRTLSHKRILNLGGQTNTDLKLQYGPANLPELTEYDNNYITLVNTLAKWGSRLISLERPDDAISVLEYGISVKTDVSRNYYLLADQYKKRNQPDKIDALIATAYQLDSIMRKSILSKLREIRSFCD